MNARAMSGRAPVMGVDETYSEREGQSQSCGFVADATSGRLPGTDMPVERGGHERAVGCVAVG